MKTKHLAAIAVLLAATAPQAASAQFGGLKLPGSGGGSGGGGAASVTAVDPDSFLAETVETTKYMMVAAALLADAAGEAKDQAERQAYFKAINEAQNVKELNAHIDTFKADVQAFTENGEAAAKIEATYAQASAEQKERIAAATFNFALGVYRNVRLAQQASQVVDSVKSNPRLITRLGQLKLAAELIAIQAKSTVQMAGSVRKIMNAAKIEAPPEAETTKPKAVAI